MIFELIEGHNRRLCSDTLIRLLFVHLVADFGRHVLVILSGGELL